MFIKNGGNYVIMEQILDSITSFINKNRQMDSDNLEILRYGLELFLLKYSFMIAILIIALMLNSFYECLIFIAFFSVLRTSAGGYHASTRIECFVESVITFVLVIIILKTIEKYNYSAFVMGLATVSFLFIWIFSPIDTENKPLDSNETAIYRKKTRIILCTEAILSLGAFYVGFYTISYSIIVSFIITAILLLIGLFKK